MYHTEHGMAWHDLCVQINAYASEAIVAQLNVQGSRPTLHSHPFVASVEEETLHCILP